MFIILGEKRDRDGDERPLLCRSKGFGVSHHQTGIGRDVQLCTWNDRVRIIIEKNTLLHILFHQHKINKTQHSRFNFHITFFPSRHLLIELSYDENVMIAYVDPKIFA